MSKVIVITGASRGIGFELAKTLAAHGDQIIAVVRKPEAATNLQRIPNIIGILKGDMGDLASLPQVAEDIAKLAPSGIDELWNNAGQSNNRAPITDIDPISYHQELAINVVGPSALTKYLLPLLRKRQTKKIIFMTSAMGSTVLAEGFIRKRLKGEDIVVTEDFLELNAYCAGKSALTMEALGWHGALYPEGFTVVAIHPGWVQTDMTGGPGRAHLTTEQSITGMLKTIGNINRQEEFFLYNYSGETIPF